MCILKHHFKKQQNWGFVCYNKVTIEKGSQNGKIHNNDNFWDDVVWVVGIELGRGD